MRKIYISALTVLAFAGISSAQEKGTVEFGVQLGYSSVSVASSEVTADSGGRFTFGGSADYYFSDRWSIKAKLNYDPKGWDNGFYIDDEGFEYTTDYKLTYLTIPIMANWHFGSKRAWYLHFGPYVGILMAAEETENGTDVKEAFNTTDFGLDIGIGVKIPLNQKMKLFFEFDAQSGFSNIFKESDINVRNGRSSFNVGMNFLLK